MVMALARRSWGIRCSGIGKRIRRRRHRRQRSRMPFLRHVHESGDALLLCCACRCRGQVLACGLKLGDYGRFTRGCGYARLTILHSQLGRVYDNIEVIS